MAEIIKKAVYTTYEDYPVEDLLLYAGVDCIATSEIAAKLVPKLCERPNYTTVSMGKKTVGPRVPMMWAVDNVTKLCHEYIVDMEINGFKYDIEENRRLAARMVREVLELEDLIFGPTGVGYRFEITSAGLSKLLYQDLGWEPVSFTKTGEPSTDGDALRAFQKEKGLPWLEWLAKRNDINAAYNTFIRTYVEDFVKPDGRIHPSYNLHGTSSFRITGDSPNLTQLPRTRYGYNIRNCYTVDDGYVFMAFDFSSAEVDFAPASRDGCREPV